MKKIILIFSSILLIGCNNSEKISEQEVIDTIYGMFDSFSVESENKNNFYNFVTDDYVLYEIGKKMNAEQFLEFASTFNTVEDDWELSDINISIDNNSAHAYFKNKGRFVTQNEGKKTLLNYEWMESAYMVKENGKLKIKFYFSDSVKETAEDLN